MVRNKALTTFLDAALLAFDQAQSSLLDELADDKIDIFEKLMTIIRLLSLKLKSYPPSIDETICSADVISKSLTLCENITSSFHTTSGVDIKLSVITSFIT